MKGRKLTLILVMLLVLVCSFALTACHEHTAETEWVYDNAGHWHEATCKHTGEKVDYDEHSLFQKDATPATCTSTGNNQYWFCATCGAAFKDEQMTTPTYDYAEVTPMLAHVYDQKVTNANTLVSAATCTSKAVYYYTCKCGAVGTDTFESGTFADHDLTLIPAVAANCLQAGNNAYYQCNDCDAYFRDAEATIPTNPDAEVLPITGHTPVYHAGEVATCTKEGKAEYWTCDVCDKMFEDAYCTYEISSVRPVPVAPHSYSNVADAKYIASAATCETVATYYESCTVCGAQGKNTFEFGSLAAHTLSEIAAVAPTCTEAGNNRYYQCSVCEEYFADLAATQITTPEQNVVSATGHIYDQKVADSMYLNTTATCLQKATYYKSCVCGKFDKQLSETFESGGKGAHVPGTVVEAKAPVCATQTDGNIAYCYCALCSTMFTTVDGAVVELNDGYVENGGIMVKWAHTWADIVKNDYLKDQATCVNYETYYKSCEVCGTAHDSEVFEYGVYRPHTHGELVPAKQVNCLEDGNVAYSICPVCEQCIDENAQVIGDGTLAATVIATPNGGKHDYRGVYYNDDPSKNYIYREATCTSAAIYHKTCVNCGIINQESTNEDELYFEYGSKLPHDYYDWVEAKAPQCEEDGNVKYRECKSCCQYFDENDIVIPTYVISRTGHKEVQVVKDEYIFESATCTSRAKYYTSCETCGIALSSTFETGELAPHALTHYEATPASCGVEGNIEYYECDDCGNFFLPDGTTRVDNVTIPALEHGWVSEIRNEAEQLYLAQSCTNAATYYQICFRCGEINEEVTFTNGQPAPHKFDWDGGFHAYTAPTCTVEGNVAYYECEECGNFFDENKEEIDDYAIAVVPHNWVEDTNKEVLVAEATCQTLAKYEKVCSICGEHASEYDLEGEEFYFTTGELADHAYGEWNEAVPAECGVAGKVAHYACATEGCGRYFDAEKQEIANITIEALEHNFVVVINDPDNYRKSEADCLNAEVWYYACEYCDVCATSDEYTYTVGEALGHDLEGVELNAYVAATCTQPGQQAHRVCNRCECAIAEDGTTIIEEVVIAKLNHNFTKKLVEDSYKLSDADCENAAVYYFACANENCDEEGATSSEYTYTEGEALGHNYGEWIAAVPASCTTIGTQAHYNCSVCGKYFDGDYKQIGTKLEDIQIPSTGHSMTQDPAGLTDTYLASKATCIAPATYFEYCSVCKEKGEATFSYGEVAVLCDASTLTHYEAITEFDFDVDEFPANCQYEHWQCELCKKYYADALGDKQFTQNNGNPKYTLERRTMAIGKMVDNKFDTNVDTILSLATGYSYTIGGIVPYIHSNWGQEGLAEGNRVAIQFAARYFVYGKTQTGVIARLTSGSYVKEFTADNLQLGSTENNIEAGSLLAIFNLSPDTDIKLEVLAETGWITYTFKLATGIEMVQYVPAVDATYWNSGNKAYYTLGEGRYFEDGFATTEIADLSTHLLAQLPMTFEATAGEYAKLVETDVAGAFTLEGAIISVAGVAKYTLTIKENLASLFAHVAEDEVVLKITIGDQEPIGLTLTQFDFTADGYYTKDFDVVAGQTIRIALRNPKVVDSYVTFVVTVADDFVTPSFEKGVPATFWADGIRDNYILNEVRYVDVYCTEPLAEENYVQPKLVAQFTVGQDATYSLVENVLNGVVAYNAEANAYIATILFDARLADYEGLIITINGQAVEVATVLANGYDFAVAKDATLTIALTLGEATETYTITLDEEIKAPKFIEATLPTLLADGLDEHYKCSISGKYFVDALCEEEVAYEDLATARLMPTVEAGHIDAQNAFVVGGVYYSVSYNAETKQYVLSGSVVGGVNLPADQYTYGYIVRFVDDFTSFYAQTGDDEVIVKITYADGKVVELKKSEVFDANGKVIFKGDAYEEAQFSFYNPATTDWVSYTFVIGDLNRIEILANAQVGAFDAEGNFTVGRRKVYNKATGAFDIYENLAYTVSVNDKAEYEISGLVPSAQDVNGRDTNVFNFTLRFDYDFKAIFAEASDDTVVMKYVTPNGTELASYTKAQVLAREISLFFTADATVSGTYKCLIMSVDGQSVWMEYRIIVADDVVCPVFNYETAPNYWSDGYKQHYSNARVEGKYYADYNCTQELNAEDVVIAKIYNEGMIAGSYVSDNNGGYKFGTYDHIKYNFAQTETNVYTVSGSIPCYNDQRDEETAEKSLHKMVVKIKGSFQANYNYYKDTDVIAKVYVNGELMAEITKAEMLFDADGSIIFVYEVTKGATIALDLLSPRYAQFGALVYTFNVSNDVVLTHDLHYVEKTKASYWQAGELQAFCDDCGAEVPLDPSEALTEKLAMPTIEAGSIAADGEGYKYVTNEDYAVKYDNDFGYYYTEGEIMCGNDVRYPDDATRFVFKFVGNFRELYADYAEDEVLVYVYDACCDEDRALLYKDDVMFDAEGNLIISVELWIGCDFDICLANPVDGDLDALVYDLYIDDSLTINVHPEGTAGSVTATYWVAGSTYMICNACESMYDHQSIPKLALPTAVVGTYTENDEGDNVWANGTTYTATAQSTAGQYKITGSIPCMSNVTSTRKNWLITFRIQGDFATLYAGKSSTTNLARMYRSSSSSSNITTTMSSTVYNIPKSKISFDADGSMIFSMDYSTWASQNSMKNRTFKLQIVDPTSSSRYIDYYFHVSNTIAEVHTALTATEVAKLSDASYWTGEVWGIPCECGQISNKQVKGEAFLPTITINGINIEDIWNDNDGWSAYDDALYDGELCIADYDIEKTGTYVLKITFDLDLLEEWGYEEGDAILDSREQQTYFYLEDLDASGSFTFTFGGNYTYDDITLIRGNEYRTIMFY